MSKPYWDGRVDRGGNPRDWLVEALAASMTNEQARAVVDALDVYLSDGPDREVMVLEDLTPNYRGEVEKLRSERDAAIGCAKRMLETMQKTLEGLSDGGEESRRDLP